MSTTDKINSLTVEHLLSAVKAADAGRTNGFKSSTTYDAVVDGKRYPPKRLVGLALEAMTGETFAPNTFIGGADRACFRALERCGIAVQKKTSQEK